MFSKEVIGKMKKGAYLVNNARGAIVDREAVVEACKSGQLGGTHPTPLSIPPCPLPNPSACRFHSVPIFCLPCVLSIS